MTRKRVLVVIGTRPEGIKLAPVIAGLRERHEVECRVTLTGQHTDLMRQVIDALDIPVDDDLGVMRDGQDLYDVTGACLAALRPVLREHRPDMVVVEGDTASVFAAALAGFFERTRVAHVEAGLRSGDRWRPWPEEIFRRLAGVVADLHFAPTTRAAENLRAEGIPADAVRLVGNTVVDALLTAAGRPHVPGNGSLAAALESGRRLVLLTAHRRESFGKPLRDAFSAVRRLADRFEDIEVLYPVHPNPNVREAAAEVLGGHARIRLTEPLGYLDIVAAMRAATLILTDSGGIQEEAPAFGRPVIVLREVTERPEGVEAEIALLAGTDPTRIESEAARVLQGDLRSFDGLRRLRPAGRILTRKNVDDVAGSTATATGTDVAVFANPYGDGRAGRRIADIVVHELTGAPRATEDWGGPAG